jgi:outer membrane receptor for ferrienterochelin and colicin
VERVAFFEDNVSITRPINLGTSRANGAELNGKLRVSKSITLSGDFNYNFFDREAELDGVSFDFTASQFNGRLVSKLELPFDLDLEVAGNVQSGVETVQGRVSGFAFMDVGLRKKAMKGRLVFNASVRDAFASRIRESEAVQPNFTTYNYSLRGRFITFGVSYGFGKGEAMEFAGRRRY